MYRSVDFCCDKPANQVGTTHNDASGANTGATTSAYITRNSEFLLYNDEGIGTAVRTIKHIILGLTPCMLIQCKSNGFKPKSLMLKPYHGLTYKPNKGWWKKEGYEQDPELVT